MKLKLKSFSHEKSPLSNKVLATIKPIYEALTIDELLERCLESDTQNNNKNLNTVDIYATMPEVTISNVRLTFTCRR